MPELPEVETVRRGLIPAMEASTIVRADVRRPDLRWPLPDQMADRLTGKTVLSLGRRSKTLLLDLSSGETLLWHLGMSGRVLISGDVAGSFHHDHPPQERHDHVVFHMETGGRVTFNDPRRFGAMDLTPTETLTEHKWLAHLGPEPLGNEFDETYLAHVFAGRKTPIKAALLDQKTVAGLGNIYVSEALHRAGISPKRLAGRVSKSRIAALVPAIRDVLREAIEAGGSSLRDHRQASGELGYFQHSFRVYDREGAECQTPDCPGVIKRIVQSGRSSYYCPQCQR
jgi:formamidopyrimidine-DNA glycosylase